MQGLITNHSMKTNNFRAQKKHSKYAIKSTTKKSTIAALPPKLCFDITKYIMYAI